MFDDFKLFYSLVFTCDFMVVRLLLFALVKTFLPLFLIEDVYPGSIFSYDNQWLKIIEMKLNNYMTINDMGINSSHKNINWLDHLYLKYNWPKIVFVLLYIHYNIQPWTWYYKWTMRAPVFSKLNSLINKLIWVKIILSQKPAETTVKVVTMRKKIQQEQRKNSVNI